MASVTSTQLISDTAQPDGRRLVRYRFDLLDNANANHVVYIGPKLVAANWDTDADMTAIAGTLIGKQAKNEVNEMIEQISEGGDPLHVDLGGFFEKTVPLWQTWDEAFYGVSVYFWSLPNQLELVPFVTCWARPSNTDKRNALGIDNQTVSDMAADMQTAINTQAALASYSPYFEPDGTLR